MSETNSRIRDIWRSLSWSDRLLPVAIICSIVVGTIISKYCPGSRQAFQGVSVLNVSVPLAIGMVIMIIPPLCRLRWDVLFNISGDQRHNLLKQLCISIILNWIVCPFCMLCLAWVTLFDVKAYMNGIILIGIGGCIAMVLLWNRIAKGNESLCAIIVIMNSILQLLIYAPYKIFFCDIMGRGSTFNEHSVDIDGISGLYSTVAKTVGFFLGIPFASGIFIRGFGVLVFGRERFDSKVMTFISPCGTIGLLYTIIVIFIEKGDSFINTIGVSFRCFIPLIAYFTVTWFGTFIGLRWYLGRGSDYKFTAISCEAAPHCGCEKQLLDSSSLNGKSWKRCCSAKYQDITTQAFTAASNNFELALAVSVALYGSDSSQAVAATYGPLIEIPVLLFLTLVSQYLEKKWLWADPVVLL